MFKKKVEFKGKVVVGGKDMKKLKRTTAEALGVRSPRAVLRDASGVPARLTRAAIPRAVKRRRARSFRTRWTSACRKWRRAGPRCRSTLQAECPSSWTTAAAGSSRYARPVESCARICRCACLGPTRLDLAWRQTAMALWEAPDALPFFVVAQPVSKFVCGGADLMLPGVRAISHESLREGSLAAIKVAGNPLPFAVGVVLFDPSQAAAAEGRVLQLLQTYRDGLWEAGGEAQPNAGFSQDQVFPTEVAPDVGQPTAAAAVSAVVAAGAGGAVGAETEGQECRGEDRPAVGTEEQTRGQTDAEEDEEEDGAGGEAAAEMDALLEKCFLQVRGSGQGGVQGSYMTY